MQFDSIISTIKLLSQPVKISISLDKALQGIQHFKFVLDISIRNLDVWKIMLRDYYSPTTHITSSDAIVQDFEGKSIAVA